MVSRLKIMNWNGCERKRLWFNRRIYTGNCPKLKVLREAKYRSSVRMALVDGRNQNTLNKRHDCYRRRKIAQADPLEPHWCLTSLKPEKRNRHTEFRYTTRDWVDNERVQNIASDGRHWCSYRIDINITLHLFINFVIYLPSFVRWTKVKIKIYVYGNRTALKTKKFEGSVLCSRHKQYFRFMIYTCIFTRPENVLNKHCCFNDRKLNLAHHFNKVCPLCVN
jgi:hypothetical protein